MKKLPVLSLFLFSVTIIHAHTQKASIADTSGTWELIGSTSIYSVINHEVILVRDTYDNFKKLKFTVTNSPLILLKMVVTYDAGNPEKINSRSDIKDGGESRIIVLKGSKRRIKSIEFWYEPDSILNGKANVSVFGMK
jgi:hypothetical protein